MRFEPHNTSALRFNGWVVKKQNRYKGDMYRMLTDDEKELIKFWMYEGSEREEQFIELRISGNYKTDVLECVLYFQGTPISYSEMKRREMTVPRHLDMEVV